MPQAQPSKRNRAILLLALGAAVVAVALYNFWPESANAPRDAFEAASSAAADVAARSAPEELEPAPQPPTPSAPARLERR